MGKPKFSRKKYETPSHPWEEERIKLENELIKKYGLKNKKEIWKAETKLKKYRTQARELLAKLKTGETQINKESNQLLMRLDRVNILPPNSTLDDVLALDTESILSRRLQTLTYLKGLANTPTHARQLISHGHIAIGARRVTVPGYMVTREEEGEISYTLDSPLNDTMHPARPRADLRSMPFPKTTKLEETEKIKVKETKEIKEDISESKKSEEKTKKEIPKPEKIEEKTSKEQPEEKAKKETSESKKSIEKPPEKQTTKTDPVKNDQTKPKTTEEKSTKNVSEKKSEDVKKGDSK